MALPTIVSISQDALSAVGRDMREGSLALGATRFETIFKVILPCAKSGIAVAVILGFMRVIGETMVVWMASGNSLKIPEPFYNFFEPVRTLTATIAGEMGEADQTTGSARYHVLFAMSLCLLVSGMALNWLSQRIISRGAFARKKGRKMKTSTRKILDKSFSALALSSMAIMCAAAVAFLAPIIINGSGAVWFKATVEHFKFLRESPGQGVRPGARRHDGKVRRRARKALFADARLRVSRRFQKDFRRDSVRPAAPPSPKPPKRARNSSKFSMKTRGRPPRRS